MANRLTVVDISTMKIALALLALILSQRVVMGERSDAAKRITCGYWECPAGHHYCDDSMAILKCRPCTKGPCDPEQVIGILYQDWRTRCLQDCPGKCVSVQDSIVVQSILHITPSQNTKNLKFIILIFNYFHNKTIVQINWELIRSSVTTMFPQNATISDTIIFSFNLQIGPFDFGPTVFIVMATKMYSTIFHSYSICTPIIR